MLDYGIPEPHSSPIIAPGDSKALCKKKHLPSPARPDWLCLTSPEYRNFHSSYNYEAHEPTDEEIETKEKAKRDKEEALEALRNTRIEAAMKREAERRAVSDEASKARQKKRAENQRRLLSKKIREEKKETLRQNMAIARDARVLRMAENLKAIPPEHIKTVRIARNLKLEEMAKLLGVTNSAVSSYESGRCSMGPTVQKKFERFEKDTKEVADGKDNR